MKIHLCCISLLTITSLSGMTHRGGQLSVALKQFSSGTDIAHNEDFVVTRKADAVLVWDPSKKQLLHTFTKVCSPVVFTIFQDGFIMLQCVDKKKYIWDYTFGK